MELHVFLVMQEWQVQREMNMSCPTLSGRQPRPSCFASGGVCVRRSAQAQFQTIEA